MLRFCVYSGQARKSASEKPADAAGLITASELLPPPRSCDADRLVPGVQLMQATRLYLQPSTLAENRIWWLTFVRQCQQFSESMLPSHITVHCARPHCNDSCAGSDLKCLRCFGRRNGTRVHVTVQVQLFRTLNHPWYNCTSTTTQAIPRNTWRRVHTQLYEVTCGSTSAVESASRMQGQGNAMLASQHLLASTLLISTLEAAIDVQSSISFPG